MTCLFCGSPELEIFFKNKFHPLAQWHGPFDFYRCKNCESGITLPLPSSAQLTRLYESFEGGMMPQIRELRDDYPLNTWFNQCVSHALAANENIIYKPDVFSWIDFGAGSGELSKLLMNRFPHSDGIAADFHDVPEKLVGSKVKWVKTDLNGTFIESFSSFEKANYIFLITVLEHLMHPDIFIGHAIQLLKPGGCFYLTVPRIDCMAFALLKERWPYMIAGEHLNIPSIKGMEILLFKTCNKVFGEGNCKITVKPVILPYPVGYYLQYFGLKKLAKKIPSDIVLRIPTGLLEASVVLRQRDDQG